ncbi:hypothetical protein OVA26_16375 [Microbacterium sp. SL62]|uniref:hypothetical protein n=1 Tax=Microbacterium sp. SL62 TaxID=2995139 RepID=UPI002275986C|nr:hypothetical protein [Microbacterium sp. SL62]MCY1718513.1 hypothetical protein [Microbacterium sp. SL62]
MTARTKEQADEVRAIESLIRRSATLDPGTCVEFSSVDDNGEVKGVWVEGEQTGHVFYTAPNGDTRKGKGEHT